MSRTTYFLSLFFLTVSGFQSVAQQGLLARVNDMPEDTVKVIYIRKLVDSLRERSSRETLQLALEGKLISERLGYQKGLAYMLESIGWMHYRNSDLSEALKITTEALRIAKEAGEMSIAASCLISVAAIHYEQKHYDLAIIHFKEAAAIGKKVNDVKSQGRSMNNIGFAFIQKQNFDSALYYSKMSYELGRQNNEFYVQGFSCRNLGEIATGQHNFTRAIIHYNEGLKLAESSDNNYLKISILYRLGAVYNALGNPGKAIPILLQAVTIGKKFGYRDELERALKLISESYIQLEDPSTAYVFQSEYIALHDSLTNQRRMEQLSLAQAKFDSELKQAEIEVLTRDAALQQEAYTQQRLLTYFFIGCANVFLIFMFVLWYNNKRIKAAKKILEVRNNEIKKQATMLRETNATKDKLFSIISHDLRSPIGGLKGLMELISRAGLSQDEFVHVSQNLRRNIDSVYDDLDNLLHWAQTQLNGIKSNKVEFNLFNVVSDKMHLFEEVARAKDVTLINYIEEDFVVNADKNQMGLVLRNLIANAVKFSTPGGSIKLTAVRQGDKIEIQVIDSGVGMSTTELSKLFKADTHFTKRGTQNEKGLGLGLILVKEFIEVNGGAISVTSEMGVGSTFSIVLYEQPVLVEENTSTLIA